MWAKLRRIRFPDGRSHEVRWLVAAAAVLTIQQVGIRTLGQEGVEALFRRGIFVSMTLALVFMALVFRRFVGAWLVAAGIALNLIPMAAHGGLMPVSFETVQGIEWLDLNEGDIGEEVAGGKDILLRAEDIHFPWLADRFEIEVPIYGPNLYSFGDIVLFSGLALAFVQALGSVFVPGLGRDRSRSEVRS